MGSFFRHLNLRGPPSDENLAIESSLEITLSDNLTFSLTEKIGARIVEAKSRREG